MKLSIITICYNQPDIEETCEAIVNQSFQDFEWIVVDGGSTDDTVKKLEKYKSRINVLISEKDEGRYDAMNKGIKLAKGEWLTFVNGGDRPAENAYQKLFENKDYDADILYCYLNMQRVSGEQVLCTFPQVIDKEYLLNNSIGHPSSFIRRELFDKYGLYEKQYQCISDWGKWICFFVNGCKFELVPEVAAIYKDDGITFSVSKKVQEQNLNDRKEIVSKYYQDSELKNLVPYEKTRFRLLGFIPFIKIFKYLNKTKFFLFEIPLLTVKK